MGLACSGFQVLVHNKLSSLSGDEFTQTHYWALRQQARHLFVPSGKPGVVLRPGKGCGVLSLHFGGGVWCLICG